MKKILFAASAAGLFAATSAFAQTAEIGTWAGFRKGATSFTFDDGPQNNVDKCLPMFKTYGYNATFNIVVNWANQPSQGMIGWSDVQKLADAGHEIASHSNSHGQNMSGEEASSKKAINDKIKQQYGVITVAYPNCNVPDVNALKQNYIAGRICGNGQEVMSKDGPGDWFKVPAYMTGSTGQYNNTNAFTGAMQQAVNKGGWVMFLTHGFTTGANGWADYSPTDANAIEGALNRVVTFVDLNHDIPLSLDIAQHLLKDSIEEEKTIKDLTVDEIMRTVALAYGVKMEEILSKERTQTLVTPRQVAMFLSCKLTTRSLQEIGRSFGKTHATVYHGAQTIQKRIDVESELKKTVENITSQLGRNPSELTK